MDTITLPVAAFRVLKRSEYYILIDLYHMAQAGKATAFSWDALAERWGISAEVATDVLERLNEAGAVKMGEGQAAFFVTVPKLGKAQKAPREKGVPEWAASDDGVRPRDLAQAVTDAVDCIVWPTCDKPEDAKKWPKRRGKYAAAGDARPVLSLWRSLDRPPLDEFVDQVRLVAWAARSSSAQIFRHDIRGEGWENRGGADRSRSVQTLLRQSKWTEVLRAAEADKREELRRRKLQQREDEMSEAIDRGEQTLPSLGR